MVSRYLLSMVALIVFADSFASDPARHAEVDIEVIENEVTLLRHKAIVEIGSPVQMTSTPLESGAEAQPTARLDYEVTEFGVTESGQSIVTVQGVASKKNSEDAWVVLTEFRTGVHPGRPATQSTRRESGEEIGLAITITPLKERGLESRLGALGRG